MGYANFGEATLDAELHMPANSQRVPDQAFVVGIAGDGQVASSPGRQTTNQPREHPASGARPTIMKSAWGPLGAAVVVVALALCSATPALASGPTVSISPLAGPPGTSITVEGSGFCGGPSCTPVSIEFNGEAVSSKVQVNPSGTFQVVIQVPGGNAGSNEVVATQQEGG
jgi:hypothetical protein